MNKAARMQLHDMQQAMKGLPPNESRGHCPCGRHVAFGSFALMTGIVGVTISALALSLVKLPVTDQRRYSIVLDAGLSSTSLHVYQWDGTKSEGRNGTAVVEQVDECLHNKGLTNYIPNTSLALESFDLCLQKASDKIPEQLRKSTRLYLAGTDGLRLLR